MNAYSTPHLKIYNNDETTISFPFSYNIYAVKGDKMYCKYRLDLEGKDFKYDWVKHPGFHEFNNQFKKSNKKFDFGGYFLENEHFALFLLYTKKIGKPQTLLFNKSTGNTFKTKLKFPKSNLHINPKITISNKFAAAIYAHKLIEHGLHKKYKELENLHENDNPCLVLFSIKNN